MTATPERPVDINQLQQRVAWLDEERRRDRSELARLTQEVQNILAILKDQAAKMGQADERVQSVESTLARLPRLEDAITAARAQVAAMRDTDIRLQDEISRQSKDFAAQSSQATRLWSEATGRLENLSKSLDALAHRLDVAEAQRKDQASRLSELSTRLDSVSRSIDDLTRQMSLADAQRQDLGSRLNEAANRLLSLNKAADDVAERIQLLEARDKERVERDANVQVQITRIESAQTHALEEVKRVLARTESLTAGLQELSKKIAVIEEDAVKRDKAHLAAQTELKEAIAAAQRELEGVTESLKLLEVRTQHLEDGMTAATDAMARLGTLEEQLHVLQATYKGLEEVENQHWGTEIPLLQHTVEEASASCERNSASVQELVSASQELKEAVRDLQMSLAREHTFSEELAAALRSLIEQDLQARLAATQKQLQSLRRLANAPAERAPDNE